jgi:hypothetical protein
MPTRTLLQNIQRRLPHYLEPSVAACANMSVADLQQVVAGTYALSPAQTDALAKRLQLMPYQFPNTASRFRASKPGSPATTKPSRAFSSMRSSSASGAAQWSLARMIFCAPPIMLSRPAWEVLRRLSRASPRARSCA